jgi:hypothetical protein
VAPRPYTSLRTLARPLELLRRGEPARAHGEPVRDLALRHAEVGEAGPPVGGDQDVPGLHVAVEDSRAVRGLERLRERDPEPHELGRPERAALDPREERAPRHELHHEQPRLEVRLVRGDHVRVPERGDRPRLVGDLVLHAARGGDLDRDGAIEPRVAGLEDHAARAGAERPHELVARRNARRGLLHAIVLRRGARRVVGLRQRRRDVRARCGVPLAHARILHEPS